MKKQNYLEEKDQENKISRKEAMQKAGKYAAFTAASMMLLMSPVNGEPTHHSIKKPKPHH